MTSNVRKTALPFSPGVLIPISQHAAKQDYINAAFQRFNSPMLAGEEASNFMFEPKYAFISQNDTFLSHKSGRSIKCYLTTLRLT